MNKIFTIAVCSLSIVCLTSCNHKNGIDWNAYSNDYNTLIKCESFDQSYPFAISGEARKSDDIYRLVITIDSAKELIENIRIIVCSQDEKSEYIHGESAKAPFLGYNEQINLGPQIDSLTNTYAGLNLAFASTNPNPKMKISVKGNNVSYYMLFNNFVMEE